MKQRTKPANARALVPAMHGVHYSRHFTKIVLKNDLHITQPQDLELRTMNVSSVACAKYYI